MRKNLYLGVLLFFAILISLTSCVNQKQIVYFQKSQNQSDTIAVVQAYVPKIQPGDLLEVDVGSLNPLASSFFNPYSTMPVTSDNSSSGVGGSSGLGGNSGISAITGQTPPAYLVDSAGTIEFPVVGAIKVSGLSTTQARDVIKNKLKDYLKETTVNVRLLNFKVSVIGEVIRPSVYVIPNERVTLPEVLSMAGDLTIYGKRTNIMVIRDLDGKKVFGHVDLTSRSLYSSPYYYLRANDVVYVEPTKVRIQQSDPIFKVLPVVLSALSIIVLSIYYGRHS